MIHLAVLFISLAVDQLGMCGRTACTLAPDELVRACAYRGRGGGRRQPRWRDGDADQYRPSYNKSPQSMSPVLLSQRHFDPVRSPEPLGLVAAAWSRGAAL